MNEKEVGYAIYMAIARIERLKSEKFAAARRMDVRECIAFEDEISYQLSKLSPEWREVAMHGPELRVVE